ncbi:MAG: 4-(cytidine 5'-diphospho)-2-C-methyl-D-erythritol kinase, partial [Actinomycetota bacterium]|nr:4-(cytidine 5'-diphospho)-2-C-methyl-D-erythritol kinase [Actinomycetota bacterium]
ATRSGPPAEAAGATRSGPPAEAAGANVHIKTHAKVNLFLRVLGLRADGYHEVETILHGIEMGDEIEITLTDTGKVEIDMSLADSMNDVLPTSEQNIAFHAAQRLLDQGARNEGVEIRIRKRIPIGAGLGGGSGNAAGVLVALNELWKTELNREGLLGIAGGIGADVPYCLSGGTTLATARGESLTPLPSPKTMWFVLGISNRPLLTREVYDAWEANGSTEQVGSAEMTLALGGQDVEEVAALLHNDLERPAFALRPELVPKKQALIDAGALGAAMSGSGPTLFAVASDEAHAQEIAGKVRGDFDSVVVTCSRPECIERLD